MATLSAMTTMTNTYRAVQLRGKGGLDQLVEVELPLVDPAAGEIRIRVTATGVGFTDITMRTGYYPYRPAFPFVPGYEVVGEVDAIGAGVTGVVLGQRVCALTVHGGYAERLTREAEHFVAVPDGVDDADTVALVLNYVTAYQMIHRSAAMKPGQTALVTGANGGVGMALVELLGLAKVRVIAACSERHFAHMQALGAVPIPSRGRPLDVLVHELEADGVDAAFDGLGGPATRECVRATRKGGTVVAYGFMAARVAGRPSTWATLRGFASLAVGGRLAGRRPVFYGITQIYRKDPTSLREDLPKLLELLRTGQVHPKIAARLPLLAGARAQAVLERGAVIGKIVLVRDGADAS